MPETAKTKIPLTMGLKEIKVGVANDAGTMPVSMEKMGKVYRETCTITQDEPEVTEYYEEGASAPEESDIEPTIPHINFSLMDVDPDKLKKYIGGSVANGQWSFDGKDVASNVAIELTPKKGYPISIPNARIIGTLKGGLKKGDLLLLDIQVIPQSVSAGGAIYFGTKSA